MDQGVKVDSHHKQKGDRRPTVANTRNLAGFQVRLVTPLGPIRGQVAIDTGPMRLADLVPTTYELTDILVQRAARLEEKIGRRISCGPKCGLCCRQMVPLSAPEAFFLTDLIESQVLHRQKELQKLFQTITDQLNHHGMIDELLRPDYSDDSVLAIAKQYFQLQMACPFLVAESCSIHPYRPVACREYNVTSPAAWCADPYSHDIVKVSMVMPLSAPLARLTAQLTHSAPRLIPLTLVPKWVAEHNDLRHMEWSGLKLFQGLMDEIGRHSASETGMSKDGIHE